jgi:hypothetical protein
MSPFRPPCRDPAFYNEESAAETGAAAQVARRRRLTRGRCEVSVGLAKNKQSQVVAGMACQ